MKLREVRIENYRNLKNIRMPIGDTTVLIGENNSGKTAFLDAIRTALQRTTSGKGNPFDEHDYHMTPNRNRRVEYSPVYDKSSRCLQLS